MSTTKKTLIILTIPLIAGAITIAVMWLALQVALSTSPRTSMPNTGRDGSYADQKVPTLPEVNKKETTPKQERRWGSYTQSTTK